MLDIWCLPIPQRLSILCGGRDVLPNRLRLGSKIVCVVCQLYRIKLACNPTMFGQCRLLDKIIVLAKVGKLGRIDGLS